MKNHRGDTWKARGGIAKPWLRLMQAPIITYSTDEAPLDNRALRDDVLARVEAVLWLADEPLTPKQLARLAEVPDPGEVRRQVDRLRRCYDLDRSAFTVEEVAGGYQLLTRPELWPLLGPWRHENDAPDLARPLLETLAIVAYRQPICRADIEAVRGQSVEDALKQLMELGLVHFAGRDESLGRPFLFGTTKKFLQWFGLRHLQELPLVEVLLATKPNTLSAPKPAQTAAASSEVSVSPDPSTTSAENA